MSGKQPIPSLTVSPPTNYFPTSSQGGSSSNSAWQNQPPLYENAVNKSATGEHDKKTGSTSSSSPAAQPNPSSLGRVPDTDIPVVMDPLRADFQGLVPPYKTSSPSGHEYHMDSRLDSDPAFLQRHVETCALLPPRPFVRLRGTTTESSTNTSSNTTDTKTRVDFDIHVEITPFLYSDINTQAAWNSIRLVENYQRVRRGTVFAKKGRSRSSRAQGGDDGEDDDDDETAALEAGRPSLAEWCHRYCASHTGLKCFRIRKKVVGFEEGALKSKLKMLVRNTGYRGSLAVTFPVRGDRVDIYNCARLNRWRLVTWLRWICFLSFMWIFTWPVLFFLTARFEVVVVEWCFSRPGAVAGGGEEGDGGNTSSSSTGGMNTGMGMGMGMGMPGKEYVTVSEAQWYNIWARAIRNAVVGRRQATLDARELIGAGYSLVMGSGAGDQGDRDAVMAAVDAMAVLDQRFGWGGNS